MTIVNDIDRVCPLCKNEFLSYVVVSTSRSGIESDFHPLGPESWAIKDYVYICPECLYAAYHNKEIITEKIQTIFTKKKSLLKKLIPEVKPSIKYYLCAKILEWSDQSKYSIGWTYLRAAWMARDEKNKSLEKKFRKKAVNFFREALETNDLPRVEIVPTTYIVGELNRILKNFDEAIVYFEKILNDKFFGKAAKHQLNLAERKNSEKFKFEEGLIEENKEGI